MMDYEQFEKHMAERFPRYFAEETRYGGFAIGPGWYHIVEALVGQIDTYTMWRRRIRTMDLRLARAKAKGRDAVLKYITKEGKLPTDWDEERADAIMDTDLKIADKVHWIRVAQIKEKFGGLRFYYDGGDEHISGMVTMAEVWAGYTCEQCGDRGTRRDGGWIRTLCDVHEAEYQAKKQSMRSEDE